MTAKKKTLTRAAIIALIVAGGVASTISWASVLKLGAKAYRTPCEAYRCDAPGGCPDGCGCAGSGCGTIAFKVR